jgi:hypothetical protein
MQTAGNSGAFADYQTTLSFRAPSGFNIKSVCGVKGITAMVGHATIFGCDLSFSSHFHLAVYREQ